MRPVTTCAVGHDRRPQPGSEPVIASLVTHHSSAWNTEFGCQAYTLVTACTGDLG
jgi:hypothetical protein